MSYERSGDLVACCLGSMWTEDSDKLNADVGPRRGSPALFALSKFDKAKPNGLCDLPGDYLLAIWDARERCLVVTTDPVGSYTICTWHDDRIFVWADNPDFVIQIAGIRAQPDIDRLSHYLDQTEDWYTNRSFLRGVDHLLPGQLLRVCPSGISTSSPMPWINDDRQIRYPGAEAYEAAFRSVLNQVVLDRIEESDACTVLFSGGLDSAAVSIMAKSSAANGIRLSAALGIYSEQRQLREQATNMAAYLGANLEVEAEAPFGPLGSAAFCQECSPEPFAPINGNLMAALFRQLESRGCDSVLTGFGADQLFSLHLRSFLLDTISDGKGVTLPLHLYRAYRLGWLDMHRLTLAIARRSTALIRQLLRKQSDHHGSGANRMIMPTHTDHPAWCTPGLRTGHSVSVMGQLTVHPMHLRFMRWWRTLADVHGIRIHHPFLDLRLIRFLASIPVDQRVGLDVHKKLMANSLRSELPPGFSYKKESEWPIARAWIADGSVTRILGDVSQWRLADLGMVDPEAFRAFLSCPTSSPGKIMNMAAAEQWLRARFP